MKLVWFAALLVCSVHGLTKLTAENPMIRTAATPKAVTGLTWSDCGVSGAPRYMQINALSIVGDIASGSRISVSGSGTVMRAFTATSVDASVQLGFLKFYSGKFPMKESTYFGLGVQKFDFEPKVPITPISGSYKVTARLRDMVGQELQCFLVTFKIA